MTRFGLIPILLLLVAVSAHAQLEDENSLSMQEGSAERGRLVFAQCRSCHYTDPAAGHGNGPNLHRIFGKVAGKQQGFDDYSAILESAQFVWTPRLMYRWLEDPMRLLPGTSMMSAGVPDPGQRADLIAYLEEVSVRTAPE